MLKRAIPIPQWAAITLLTALVFCLLLVRAYRYSRPPEGPSPPPVIIEVQGDVPLPGIHVLPGPTSTVSDALAAAGWSPNQSVHLIPEGVTHSPIESGCRIHVSQKSDMSTVVVADRMDGTTRFALGFKLDLNSASEEELLLVPHMKPQWARAIVEHRKQNPWKALEELDEIPGVGARTVEKWRPHLEALPVHR